MTVLYVANSTKQHTSFAYRTGFADPNVGAPPNFRLVQVPCQAGAQVRLCEGTTDDISKVILQLLQMGAVDIDDLGRRQTDVIHAIFSVDKWVPVDKMRSVLAKNDELLNDQAYLARKNLAVATHYKMNERAQEYGPDSPRPHHVIMDVEEVPRVGDDAGNRERIEVVTQGHEPRGRNRKAA